MGETPVEKYRAISPAEFFYKYREIAGFSNPARAIYQTVRELVENALDATDAHGIMPDIKISIRKVDEIQEFYRITVEDNGIGIPPDVVPDAFGRVLFSSKYVLRQTRGMYGLGVKMAVLYGQMTTGRPVEVITSKPGFKRIYYFKLRIDVNRNEPVIIERGSWRKNREWHGTIVSITIEGDWGRAKPKIKEYLFKTAIVTPYANIVALTPDDEIIYYPRIIDKIPRPPLEVKPHPHGVDLELLKQIISSHNYTSVEELLIKGFQSIGEATAKSILQQAGIDPGKPISELSDNELLSLVNTLKSMKDIRAPSIKAISPLGSDVIIAGLKRVFQPEFVYAVSRRPQAYQGHPFIVEAGIAYGGKTPMSDDDKPIILRYANKIPLLYDEGSDVTTMVVKEDISWDHYMVSFPAPIAILVHVCSTKIPFKGVGKESIADVPEVRKEIKLVLMDVLRELKKYLSKKAKEEELKKRAEHLTKYIPEVARGLSVIVANGSKDFEVKLVQKLVSIISRRTGIPESEIQQVLESIRIGT
ncbi:Type 2 DNA topoisomerase VI subunit B [Desulfurococcus amylolyticus 1221n]|uniref:Type 2 DNA topoisomerase 6 subunit B n=1 Tax=Desulfurococcus amylolyticus (strain DSM 18924 / JCM 16383 / VKM B-2413 / 1221n) TaxID=490899 RepID=B8D614_DESA1|nr:DNA topoisomerase VI subunit B [Desulfurococcus amylolyticus]ACL11545.1 Type 2 DNA topoisomerase VI subunit B [Desulfurococcus amylolyticus 1221n]